MSFFRNIVNSFKISSVLTQLIIINCAVFIILNLLVNINAALFGEFVSDNFELSSSFLLFIKHFWTLFTYMFVHMDIGHLFFNMLSFFFLGKLFDAFIGNHRMLFLYIAGGLAGGFLYLIMGSLSGYNAILCGASGSVMAIIVACGFYVPNQLVHMMFVGEIKVKWVVLILFILTSVIDISSNSGGKVAHFGGALIGMIYALQLKKGNDLSVLFNRLFTFRKKAI